MASAGALLAGIAAAFVLQGHAWVPARYGRPLDVDLLHFSLAPFSAARLALQLGLIAAHAAAVAALVTLFRASTNPWLVARCRPRRPRSCGVGASDRDLVGRAGRRSSRQHTDAGRRAGADAWPSS